MFEGFTRSGWIGLTCVVLLLTAGCVAVPVTPAAPFPSAADRITVTPFPTMTPLAAGEVLPLPTSTPAAIAPAATIAPVQPHPAGTRTGIAEVDRVIEAVTGADRSSLQPLVRFITTPCTTREGLGGPPKCRPGETDGTPVEVFPIGGPEGTFAYRADMDRLLSFPVTGLYAVYRVPAGAYKENYWPAGDYGVMFLRSDGLVLTVLITPEGIVRMDFPAGGGPAEMLQATGGSLVLPPTAQ